MFGPAVHCPPGGCGPGAGGLGLNSSVVASADPAYGPASLVPPTTSTSPSASVAAPAPKRFVPMFCTCVHVFVEGVYTAARFVAAGPFGPCGPCGPLGAV